MSLGSLVASGFSLLVKELKGRDMSSLAVSAGRQPCPVAPGWVLLDPESRRNIQAGIALLWPRHPFRAFTVLGSDDVDYGRLAEPCRW